MAIQPLTLQSQDGKVCLSLLGTWSGPGWIPGKSTLLQVNETRRKGISMLKFVETGFNFNPVYDTVRRAVSE